MVDEAAKLIFPIIVIFGKIGGVTSLHDNEKYIQNLYRQRWQIEIAFRKMKRLGIVMRSQNCNIRLGIMGINNLLYNIWQVQRYIVLKGDPRETELELDEFVGKYVLRRFPRYLTF